MNANIQIRIATPGDWEPVTTLLAQCRLPVEDLNPGMLARFLVAECEEGLVGVVGCESLGEHVLFRSLAVAPDHRGQGIAGDLTAELERRCQQAGAKTAYLLTNTAEKFAQQRGYRAIPRESAPDPVRNTAEFRHVCCSSARCMCKGLP